MDKDKLKFNLFDFFVKNCNFKKIEMQRIIEIRLKWIIEIRVSWDKLFNAFWHLIKFAVFFWIKILRKNKFLGLYVIQAYTPIQTQIYTYQARVWSVIWAWNVYNQI